MADRRSTSAGGVRPDRGGQPLARSFYGRDAIVVARALLGKVLVSRSQRGWLRGRIVEVEAYLAENDSACHGAAGRTRRNATMFGSAGHAYVYSIHARYCLNAVTEGEGVSSAVLIRAVEPLEGLQVMRRRRARDNVLDLARGPARLCEAFGIDKRLDGNDLTVAVGLWIEEDEASHIPADHIGCSPRIGVTSAHSLPLRFFLDGSRFVSGPRKYHRKRSGP